jgi:exodeoxyribonuclease VII small subunit
MARKRGFEEKLEELEEIVQGLEDGEVRLEDAVSRFQAGTKLLKDLRNHLETMEKKVELLTSDGREESLDAVKDTDAGEEGEKHE